MHVSRQNVKPMLTVRFLSDFVQPIQGIIGNFLHHYLFKTDFARMGMKVFLQIFRIAFVMDLFLKR